MITHFQIRPRLFVSMCVLCCLFALPVLAQGGNSGSTSNSVSTSTKAAPASQTTESESAEIPSWLPLAAILGCVFGLAGMGLAGWMFFNSSTQSDELKNELDKDIRELRVQVPGAAQVERFICKDLLRRQYDENSGTGFWLSHAFNDMARTQSAKMAEEEIQPKLQLVESVSSETREDVIKTREGLTRLSTHFKENDDKVQSTLTHLDQHTTNLNAAFQKLDTETRAELEAFIFNIYNLLFTQSEGGAVVPKLKEGIERYQKLLDDLRAITPDETTRLMLREFEESLGKLDSRLEEARQALSESQETEVESLPYLDEGDSAKAGPLLESHRKKMRGKTAGVTESSNALRDAVIELYKPLQTLWMGASVEDIDEPQRTLRCRSLLNEIKTIFQSAGVEVYEAKIGEEIDTKMVIPRFAGEPHEPPFLAQKMTKLGLKVEDRIDQGAVVVA